jgi:Tfp pilus assembly protein PilF
VELTEDLEAILARGEDNATMRFALGSAYLNAGSLDKAVGHLSVAVSIDPDFSAAWKLLGKAQTEAGLPAAAIETYRRGIEVATRRGDRQAVREMQVFVRRLEKTN